MSIRQTMLKEKPAASNDEIAGAMARIDEEVGRHFPETIDAVKVALAVAVVGCLKDNTQPTALFFVGPSGAGKTLPLSFLFPPNATDCLNRYVYRSDKFTAASFVSHRADLSRDELAQDVDLLPRIKGKTFVTKELAPLFRGKRDELTERFSVLASVLDGRGFISDSGAQGRRGYEGKYNFQWLGATTPLEPEALEAMGQVGPRIVFYWANRAPKSNEELAEFLARSHAGPEERCQTAVRQLLRTFFEIHPPESVSMNTIGIGGREVHLLAQWARVLVLLRVLNRGRLADSGNGTEHPERVAVVLKNIAIGSALAHGRVVVSDYDLAQVGHIALSSGVVGRGKVLRAVLDNGGRATTPEIRRLAGVSEPTAGRYMEELDAVGVVRFRKGSPATVTLRKDFEGLRDAPRLKPKGVGGSARA